MARGKERLEMTLFAFKSESSTLTKEFTGVSILSTKVPIRSTTSSTPVPLAPPGTANISRIPASSPFSWTSRRRRSNGLATDRPLQSSLAIGVRGEVEAHCLLVAAERLDVGHGIILGSLAGAARVPQRIDLADLETRQIGLLGRLEASPLIGLNSRHPFDRLKRRETLQ